MTKGLLSFAKRESPPGMVLLGRRSFRNTVFRTFNLHPDIDHYRLLVNCLQQSVAASSSNLIFGRFGVAKGALDEGMNNYQVAGYGFRENGSYFVSGFNPTSSFFIGRPDNDTGHGVSGVFDILVNSRSLYTQVNGLVLSRNENAGADQAEGVMTSTAHLNTRRVVALGVFCSTGVIVSGEIGLYGFVRG